MRLKKQIVLEICGEEISFDKDYVNYVMRRDERRVKQICCILYGNKK